MIIDMNLLNIRDNSKGFLFVSLFTEVYSVDDTAPV